MATKRKQRDPYVWEALISLFSLVAGISISIVVYGADPHIPMLLGVFVAAVIAWKVGYEWEVVQDGMLKGIANSLQAIVILCIIGILNRHLDFKRRGPHNALLWTENFTSEDLFAGHPLNLLRMFVGDRDFLGHNRNARCCLNWNR